MSPDERRVRLVLAPNTGHVENVVPITAPREKPQPYYLTATEARRLAEAASMTVGFFPPESTLNRAIRAMQDQIRGYGGEL